jgi:hypothetical protein
MRPLGMAADWHEIRRDVIINRSPLDNEVTIIGGRNVGDEYFGSGRYLVCRPHVIAAGPVVKKVSDDFCTCTGTVGLSVGADGEKKPRRCRRAVDAETKVSGCVIVLTGLPERVMSGTLPLEWHARFLERRSGQSAGPVVAG